MNKFNIPNQANQILDLLNNAGHEGYLVGGCVRDFLLKIEPTDYDIATNATVEELKKLFTDYVVIETGIKHGTVSILIDGMKIEITTYRDETRSLKGDLLLRDFTINSIAYSPREGFIDYYDGTEDINNKIIRINGSNDSRFREDPLRILRAIRLSAILNFKIDAKTKQYMIENKGLLNDVSFERINDEFTKILLSNMPSKYIREYFDIICVFIPELIPLKGFNQNNPHHIYDCLEHTLIVIDKVKPTKTNRLAALFHDSGKPHCYTEDKNQIGHFYGHHKISAEIAKKVLSRLKYDHETIYRTVNIINYHDYPLTLTTKSMKKLLNYVGTDDINDLFDIKRADLLGQNPDYHYQLDNIKQAKGIINELINSNDCFTLHNLKIGGSDLINIGIIDGKKIGYILKQLLNLVIEDKIDNEHDLLLEKAKEIKKMI